MTGTIVNTAAIIAGSLAGTLVRSKLPARFAEVIFQGIGLFTGGMGVSMWLQSDNYLPALISIVAGSLIGRWIGIGDRVDGLCARLTGRGNMTHPTGTGFPFPPKEEAPGPQGDASGFTEGLVTATIIFCVGSMSILGAIEDGTGQTPTLLYTKSVMDGITSLVLAAFFGAAVIFSAVPVFLYQGAITLAVWHVSSLMTAGMIADLTSVGGILLIGMGINILGIKKIAVLDMLPALAVIILLSYFRG